MSLYKDASLVMIPSAVKDGKLYSIRPTDGSGDFTFSRGSNLAATRVDVNGLIEKGRENQILHSNNFNDVVYSKFKCGFTSGQSGYDGSNDAWKLECTNAGNAYVFQSQTITEIKTRSVYAKAGTQSTITFLWDSFNSNEFATFDLSAGTFTNAGCLANMESVGNGWYRCSTTITDSSNGYAFLFSLSNELGSTASVGDNIYIQDAQQESGMVATDVIETGASTAQAGILEDLPRLDYSGGASCPALLLEPQRSNLIANSEYLNASPIKSAISVTSNATISPDGLQNASKLIPDTSNVSTHYIRQDVSVISGSQYVMSFFAKKGEYNYVNTYTSAYSTGASATWDLNAGVVALGSPNADIEDYGNGWYRCIWKGTTNTTSLSYRIYINEFEDRNTSFAGDGVKGAYIYGASLEEGNYPTSYIPTYGSAVTRSLDQCELLGMNASGISTSNNWTYFIDVDNFESGQQAFYLRSTSAELIHLYHQSLGYRNSSNSSSYPASWSWSSYSGNNSQVKMCIRYDGNELSVFINGSKKSDVIDSSLLNNSFYYPFDQDKFHFAGDSKWDTNQKLFFDTALTDSECIALTTI